MSDGIKEKELPGKFAGDGYQVLLVAEKYQTGFDQPLLHTMYVDKRLSGVQAVQTLSRLNRIAPGKEDSFVLDFVNEPEEIFASFQPYYEVAEVDERATPEQLYALQVQLDAAQIYRHDDVKGFCSVQLQVALRLRAARKLQFVVCAQTGLGRVRAALVIRRPTPKRSTPGQVRRLSICLLS